MSTFHEIMKLIHVVLCMWFLQTTRGGGTPRFWWTQLSSNGSICLTSILSQTPKTSLVSVCRNVPVCTSELLIFNLLLNCSHWHISLCSCFKLFCGIYTLVLLIFETLTCQWDRFFLSCSSRSIDDRFRFITFIHFCFILKSKTCIIFCSFQLFVYFLFLYVFCNILIHNLGFLATLS